MTNSFLGKISITGYFEADHDQLDGFFKTFQTLKRTDFPKAKQAFVNFKVGLQRHIVWEEEILFPLFEKKTGMKDGGPTAVMRMEHRQIKEYLEKIHDGLAKGEPNTDAMENRLIEILTAHNEKEENILYPWIDTTTDEKEREAVFEKMKKR